MERGKYKRTKKTKDKQSIAMQGKNTYKRSEETRAKLSVALTGRPASDKCRKATGERSRGENHYHWKGGKETRLVRRAFYERKRNYLKKSNLGDHKLEQWEELKELFDFMCLCCKKQEPEIKLTEDHIIPLSKGGSNDISNIQPLCSSCNSIKLTKVIDFRELAITNTNKS